MDDRRTLLDRKMVEAPESSIFPALSLSLSLSNLPSRSLFFLSLPLPLPLSRSDIRSHIFSDTLSGIYSDSPFGILSGAYSDILSGLLASMTTFYPPFSTGILTFFLAFGPARSGAFVKFRLHPQAELALAVRSGPIGGRRSGGRRKRSRTVLKI